MVKFNKKKLFYVNLSNLIIKGNGYLSLGW